MNKLAILEGLLFIVGDEGLNIKQISEILEINDNEIAILLNNEKYSKSPYISIKKFSSYFTSCYNYYKNLDKINELNKQKDEIKKEIDSLKNLEKEEKNKINESKSKNMELENNLISVEKEKYAILSDIKCHNKLMTVTKNFLQNLDDIIPELIKKKKIYCKFNRLCSRIPTKSLS